MKTAILIGILCFGGLVFVLVVTGVLPYLFNPPVMNTDDGGTGKTSTGRIDYFIFDPKKENVVIFRARVSSGKEVDPSKEDDPAAEVDATAKYILYDLELMPGASDISGTGVTIQSDTADLYQHLRGESPFFHCYLHSNVSLEARQSNSAEARQRTSLVLTTDEMEYWQEQKEIRGNGIVHIRDADSTRFHLTGLGMEGMLDLGSLIVRENAVAYLASSAFDEKDTADLSAPQNVTRITCEGPVKLRRFNRPEDIGEFVAEYEKFKALGLDDAAAVDFLSELQKRMREEGTGADDQKTLISIARSVAEMQRLPNAERLLSGDGADELLRTATCLQKVSPALDANDLAMLRDIDKKIADKDIDLAAEKGLAALTVVTFEKNVRASSRPAPAGLEALSAQSRAESDAGFSFPFIDSSEECDRMIVYCREESGARGTGGAGTEPVKIEMLRGADKQVIIKSFGPRGAEHKDLDTVQSADLAEVYTARRIYQSPSGEQQTRFVQTRMVLDGAVSVQKFEHKQESADIASTAVYEAVGDTLTWDRDLGTGRLVGTRQSRPTLTYSSAPAMAPASSAGGSGNVNTSIQASAADSIEFFRKAGESVTRVRLNRDVVIEHSEVSPEGKRRDSLKAGVWVDMNFQQAALGGEQPQQNIFSNLDSMRALGKVDLVTDKGEAWGDYLTHEKAAFADKPAAVTTLYRVTDANRKELLGDEEFTVGGDWPLRAVMTGAGSSDFLAATSDQQAAGQLETYTAVCGERIQYVDFTGATPAAGKVIFTKDVKITKTRAATAGQTTLDAAKTVELDFVNAAGSDPQASKRSFDPVRLYAEGQVHMMEPADSPGVSKLQEAKADRLTWARLSADEAGGKATDRVILDGGNGTAPEIRYSVVQQLEVTKEGGAVETHTQEEQTVVSCSADGGKITLNTLRDPAQREKPEDNYILAEGGAYVHRTGATTDAAGKRAEDAPMDLRAQKLTTYYIPATEQGASSRVKKIVAEGNVVAASDQMTATGEHGEWERIYQADIIERTVLTAAPGGTAQVRLIGKDRRGRPSDTTITCRDKVVFTRTIFDEGVSPNVASKADAVFTNAVSVERLGYADNDKKLNEDVYLACDQLNLKFSDMMRDKAAGPTGLEIAQMAAAGKADYKVFDLLKEEHKYPDERVLFSDGKADYIEYNKEGTGLMMRMKGKRSASGHLVEPAWRIVYQYDSDTRKQVNKFGETEREDAELPPLPLTGNAAP